MKNPSSDRLSSAYSLVFFCIAAALLNVCTLGSPRFGSSTEAREAHVMQEIFERERWLLPRRNGIAPSKPPFSHWLGASAAALKGEVDEFAARVPSLLAALGISLLTGILCLRAVQLAGGAFSLESRALAGVLPASILWTSYGFLSLARDARVDMVFSFWCVSALFVFLSASYRQGILEAGFSKLSGKDWMGFFVCCGFAVLSKGPLGALLPLIICSSISVVSEGWRLSAASVLRPSGAWMVFFIISCSWYAATAWSGGGDVLSRQLIFENLKRFAGGESVNNEPWWYYIPSLVRTLFPWVLVAALFLYREIRIGKLPEGFFQSAGDKRIILGRQFLWPVGAALCFFSLASGKRHSYLLPLYPLIAMYISVVLLDRLESLSVNARLRIQKLFQILTLGVILLSFGILVLFGVLTAFSFGYFSEIAVDRSHHEYLSVLAGFVFSHAASLIASLAVMLLLIGLSIIPSSGALERRWTYLSLGIVGVYSVILCVGQGFKNDLKSFPRQAEEISSRVNPLADLVVYKESSDELFDPILFYLNRPVQIQQPAGLEHACSSLTPESMNKFMLVRSSVLRALSPESGITTVTVLVQKGDEISGRSDREMSLAKCW